MGNLCKYPVKKPDQNASPAPVVSFIFLTLGAPIKHTSPFNSDTIAPFLPLV